MDDIYHHFVDGLVRVDVYLRVNGGLDSIPVDKIYRDVVTLPCPF